MTKLPYFWRRGLWTLLSLSLMALMVSCLLYIYLESQLPNVSQLENVQYKVPLRIYTADKKLIAEYGAQRRFPIAYHQVPPLLVHAILSTEDQRFFNHLGVDVLGLARAGLQLIKTGRKDQGGSTITMQVARNFFLSRKKTFLRKFNEILLAIKIDSELSKEKILELYLNKIYLGNRAYGVAAAAKVYYGKKLTELTLAQIAMIAGLPQAPSSQNPIANPTAAIKRRNHVLSRMLEQGIINQHDYQQAVTAPITASYHGRTTEVNAPYVAEMIRISLYKHFGKKAYTKGYRVYTTIDSRLQQAATKALEKQLLNYDERHGYRGPAGKVKHADITTALRHIEDELKKYPTIEDLLPAIVTHVEDHAIKVALPQNVTHTISWSGLRWAKKQYEDGRLGPSPKTASDIVTQGDIVYIRSSGKHWSLSQIPEVEASLVSLAPYDGSIRALIGGFNFNTSNFNRATQAKRQPGSSFKPFIYAAALNHGFSLASIINDAPIVLDDPSQQHLWRPHNDSRRFYGPTRLRIGLIRSRNLVSIRLLNAIGIGNAINFLQRMGFEKEDLPHSLSLALGSLSVTPLQLASAYAIFANGGFKIEPHLINKITDPKGHTILKALPTVACLSNQCSSIPTNQHAPQVLSHQVAYLITSALKDVIQHGTGRKAKVLNRLDLAGKTGTTNNQRDAWFAGFNGDNVTVTWMGYDEPKSLKEYAASTALPMWIDYMKIALAGKEEKTLAMPSNLISVRIDPSTGLRTNNTQTSIFEIFRQENVPDYQEGFHASQPEAPSQTIEHLF